MNTRKRSLRPVYLQPVTWRVYEAPWGWALQVHDSNGKQLYSGALYETRADAEAAGMRFIAELSPPSSSVSDQDE
jgi:hypothetical protein